MTGRAARRTTLWAAAGFLLLQLGWILVLPPYTGIDEFEHAYRADSVASGHWVTKPRPMAPFLARGNLIPVRADIVKIAGPACARLPYTVPFDCRPESVLSDGKVLVSSAASRYNPVYYAYVGPVARPFHGAAIAYAMRVAGAIVCAALFAFAVWTTTSWARTRWPVVATMATALPTTVYSTALIAPNGIEMMAGLALWASILKAVMVRQRSVSTYAGIGLSVALVANMHTVGPLWIAMIFATFGVLIGLRKLFDILWPHSLAEWAIALAATAASLFAVIWVMTSKVNSPGQLISVERSNFWGLLPRTMLQWVFQAIGAFPYRDEPAPTAVYALGLILLTAFSVISIRAARRSGRLTSTIAATVIGSFAAPAALTLATFPQLGLSWQGRYGMTFTAGLFLLFGLALDRAEFSAKRAPVTVALCGWVIMQIVSQAGVLTQQREDTYLISVTGWWNPPFVLLVIVGLLAAFTWVRSWALAGQGADFRD